MSGERYKPDVLVKHAQQFRQVTELYIEGRDAEALALWDSIRTDMYNFSGALGVSPPYPGDGPTPPPPGNVVVVGWPLPNGPDGAPPYLNFQNTIKINTIVAIPLDVPANYPYPLTNWLSASAVSVGTSTPPSYFAALSNGPGVMEGAGVFAVSHALEVSTPILVAPGNPVSPGNRVWFNFMIERVGIEGQTEANFNFQWSPPH